MHHTGNPRRLLVPLSCSLLLHALALFSYLDGTRIGSIQRNSSSSLVNHQSLAVTFVPSSLVRDQQLHLPMDAPPAPESPRLEPKSPGETPKSATVESQVGGTSAIPLPGIIYYPTSMLSLHPQPLSEADLDPPAIRHIIASGKVTLTLWIDPFGRTIKVVANTTDLPERFVSTATAAFEQLRFTPGELNGQRVGAVMKIEVTYDDGRLLKKEVVF